MFSDNKILLNKLSAILQSETFKSQDTCSMRRRMFLTSSTLQNVSRPWNISSIAGADSSSWSTWNEVRNAQSDSPIPILSLSWTNMQNILPSCAYTEHPTHGVQRTMDNTFTVVSLKTSVKSPIQAHRIWYQRLVQQFNMHRCREIFAIQPFSRLDCLSST